MKIQAIINSHTIACSTLKAKFEALALNFHNYHAGKSIVDYTHFSHMQIIGMGPSVIPLLLEDDYNWSYALIIITGQKVPVELHGDAKKIKEFWINWSQS